MARCFYCKRYLGVVSSKKLIITDEYTERQFYFCTWGHLEDWLANEEGSESDED